MIPPTPKAALTDEVMRAAVEAYDAPRARGGGVLHSKGLERMRQVLLAALAASPEPRPHALSEAHRHELEEMLRRVKRSDNGNFPLIQAIEAALSLAPEPRETPAFRAWLVEQIGFAHAQHRDPKVKKAQREHAFTCALNMQATLQKYDDLRLSARSEPVCEHGTAIDVHCCNCHSGFLFDADSCVCEFSGRALFRVGDVVTVLRAARLPDVEEPIGEGAIERVTSSKSGEVLYWVRGFPCARTEHMLRSTAPTEDTSDWRMSAYYYEFTRTGNAAIDRILSAVAIAGKAYHNTSEWAEYDEDFRPPAHLRGKSYAECIQNAADDAAKALQPPPSYPSLTALVEKWRQPPVIDTDPVYAAATNAHREFVSTIRRACADELESALRASGELPNVAWLFMERLHRDFPEMPAPEVCYENDGDLGFDWNLSRNYVVSASLSSTGRVAWSALLGETKGHGRFEVGVEEWPSEFASMLRAYAVTEAGERPQGETWQRGMRQIEVALRDMLHNFPGRLAEAHALAKSYLPSDDSDLPSIEEMCGMLSDEPPPSIPSGNE